MDNTNKIEELRAEADRLEKLDIEKAKLPEEYRLAEIIHSKQCRWNHTDGCGWYYEKWGDYVGGRGSRQSYVDKAKKILAKVDFETAYQVISLM